MCANQRLGFAPELELDIAAVALNKQPLCKPLFVLCFVSENLMKLMWTLRAIMWNLTDMTV